MALILIAIVSAAEVRPRSVVLNVAVPEDSPGPLNDSPYGASMLVEGLSSAGHSVIVSPSVKEVPDRLPPGSTAVYLVLGTDYFDPAYEGEVEDVLRLLAPRLYSEGGRLYVVVLDEKPSEATLRLIEFAESFLCGADTIVTLNPSPVPSRASAIQSLTSLPGISGLEWNETLLPTGYVTYLVGYSLKYSEVLGEKGNITELLSGGLPVRGALYSVPRVYPEPPVSAERGPLDASLVFPGATGYIFAMAWPSGGGLVPGLWYPVGYACAGRLGGLILLGDSTIAVNRALRVNSSYAEYIAGLLPAGSVVIFDLGLYVSEGAAESIFLKLHPSILAFAFLEAYSSAERSVLGFIRSNWIFALSLVGALAALIWSNSPIWAHGGRGKARAPRRGAPRSLGEPPIELVLESAGALTLMRAKPLLALAGVLEGLPPRRLTGPVSERLR